MTKKVPASLYRQLDQLQRNINGVKQAQASHLKLRRRLVGHLQFAALQPWLIRGVRPEKALLPLSTIFTTSKCEKTLFALPLCGFRCRNLGWARNNLVSWNKAVFVLILIDQMLREIVLKLKSHFRLLGSQIEKPIEKSPILTPVRAVDNLAITQLSRIWI